jgi:hypothetical protein
MYKQQEQKLLDELDLNAKPVPKERKIEPARYAAPARPKPEFEKLRMACAMISSILLFISALMVSVSSTILSQSFYVGRIYSSDYSNYMVKEVQNAIIQNGQNFTGAGREVFDNGITAGTVLTASADYCVSCFTGAVKSPDSSAMEDAFNAAITKYIRIESPNLKITADVAQSVVDLSKSCAKIYEDDLSIQLLPKIGDFSYKYKSAIDVFAFILAMIAIVVYTPIMFISSPNYQKIRFAVYTASALFIMLALTSGALLYIKSSYQFSASHYPLTLLIDSASAAFVTYIQIFTVISAALALFAIISFYAYDFYQKKKEKIK